jgi:hypothetical protein
MTDAPEVLGLLEALEATITNLQAQPLQPPQDLPDSLRLAALLLRVNETVEELYYQRHALSPAQRQRYRTVRRAWPRWRETINQWYADEDRNHPTD